MILARPNNGVMSIDSASSGGILAALVELPHDENRHLIGEEMVARR